MWRALFVCIALLGSSVSAFADDSKYISEYEPRARKGDYQSQRNLAYTYATSKDAGVYNPILGCAWYKLILMSGSSKVHDGDIGNVKVYCGRLSKEQDAVSDEQAKRLKKEIYK